MMRDYYRYWGKARSEEGQGPAYHLLPYHCLDVAAVAAAWWDQSPVIRSRFALQAGLPEEKTRAWVLFFVALHDLGKFDVRFQLKAGEIARSLWSEFTNADASQSARYWHGNYSSFWLFHDFSSRFDWDDDFGEEEAWDAWKPWMFAVAGHHGVIPEFNDGRRSGFADQQVLDHDRGARICFVEAMEGIFLLPAGLSINELPSACDQEFMAGFCSVCDWLGSTELNASGDDRFRYVSDNMSLEAYLDARILIAETVLDESGLLASVISAGGMAALFPDMTARQVQTLVDKVPLLPGLTIVEAPTGSGKTEAALAYASRLLDEGMAECIIFALPTQATANAMLNRLESVTETIFGNANLLLAHGKAGFNERFISLKRASKSQSPQDKKNETEAQVQCSQWLGQSRKRVFLGQVGVCTIDQVLISVLPVKHKFVRAFGLGKSVLIVDEVHAYDSYMYGLLQEVLRRQRQMQGSALLLSATLPSHQKESLVAAWGGYLDTQNCSTPYPLISHYSGDAPLTLELPEREKEKLKEAAKTVHVDVVERADMRFDDVLLKKVVAAANAGANVVLICNLVADAQGAARQLIEIGAKSVDLFHSRFRFMDRQSKEANVLAGYGKGDARKRGGILVATQVVEQSLDLDFDWMLTQLCPMDLFFQRLGRLHRHDRPRPPGFGKARCSVIVPVNHNYALHKVIYGSGEAPNSRVLWRTEQLLRQSTEMHFPDVYRPLVESVYEQEPWDDEPEIIRHEYVRFEQSRIAAQSTAWHLVRSNPNFEDSDSRVATLTRDGEMSLNVILVIEHGRKRSLLDGQDISAIEEWRLAEALSMNTVPVPASWRRTLPQEQEGLVWLPMQQQPNGEWLYENGNTQLNYSMENGLERRDT